MLVNVAVMLAVLVSHSMAADICQAPGTCSPPAAKYSKVLPLKPRLQWPNGGGFCGALSLQNSALNFGAYISQDLVRKAAPAGGGHGDPTEGYEILHTNVEATLKHLKFEFDFWQYKSQPQPQSTSYIRWLKHHLAQGHPTTWFIMCKGDGHDTYGLATYDHIEPVWGIYSNHSLDDDVVYGDDVLVHSSNWDHNRYYRRLDSLADDKAMDTNCSTARAGWPHDEAYPCLYRNEDYGIAMTGPVDPEGKAVPLALDIGRWDEPDVRSGQRPAQLTPTLTLSDLTPGSTYTLYRFDGTDTVPTDSKYDAGKYTAKHTLVAHNTTLVWTDDKAIESNAATYYRAVPAV